MLNANEHFKNVLAEISHTSWKGHTNPSSELELKRAVYAQLVLPMALIQDGSDSLPTMPSYTSLTTEKLSSGQTLCNYIADQDDMDRTDFSLSCKIPAANNAFGTDIEVELDQTGRKVYFDTTIGNDTYEAYEFDQFVLFDDGSESYKATVLIHPGIGIISIFPHSVGGVKENNVNIDQTQWVWRSKFNDILDKG